MPRSSLSLALMLLLVAASATSAQTMADRPLAQFKPPAEASIPVGPLGDAIRTGKLLVMETHQRLPKNVGNKLTCVNCHMGGGATPNAAPWVGLWGVFPEYRARRRGRLLHHQPRPDYPAKNKDWPKGDKPKDARSGILAGYFAGAAVYNSARAALFRPSRSPPMEDAAWQT